MSVPLNQPKKITGKTYNSQTQADPNLADPTEATIRVRDPRDGTFTNHVWPSGDLTRDALGTFSWTIPDDVPGLWEWRFFATGAVATSTRAGAIQVDDEFPPMLVGLDDARSELNFTATTDDDELQLVIYTASAVLLNHPSYRVAEVSKVQTYTEDWTQGGDTIVLDHYPVTSVTSVTEYTGGTGTTLTAQGIDTTSFNGYGYRLEASKGIIRRIAGDGCVSWLLGPVRVVYTAGSASVPWDVRAACLLLVDHLWETQRGGEGSGLPSGVDIDEAGRTFGAAFGPAFALPNRVRELP